MAEEKKRKSVTIEEAFRRIRPLFLMMMLFPLFGLIAAMVILYILDVKNLLMMEGLVLFAMIIYVVTTYLAAVKMGQIGKRAKTAEPEKTP